MTAEHRQALYGGKMFTFSYRQKFGNDPEKHVDLLSSVFRSALVPDEQADKISAAMPATCGAAIDVPLKY